MTKPKILHIETATNICSVALSEGENLISIRESNEDKSHGSLLSVFMDEVLEEGGVKPRGLDAISVSKGPGSYTGLRIGVSATKGFAYALKIPIIGIDTLLAMAEGVKLLPEFQTMFRKHPKILLCPLLDARRMEVFSGFYFTDNNNFRNVSADIIEEGSYNDILDLYPVVFFGNGSVKVKETLNHPSAYYFDNIVPSAKNMISLSLELYQKKQFEDSAYFEPYYLKDFVATIPRKKVL